MPGFTSSSNFNNVLENEYSTSHNNSSIANTGEIEETVKNFKKVIGKEDFDRIIDKAKDINSDLRYTRFEFSIHDVTKRVMVKIYDRASDELISEVPPEKLLDLLAGIWEQAGLIVDEKV